MVSGETVHIDATLIRADVSWESLVTEHVETVIQENTEEAEPPKRGPGRPRQKKAKPKKRSTTDPEASLTTSCNTCRMEPSYKQHGAVDDQCGVIVDVDVTTGDASEGSQLPEQITRIESNTGVKVKALTADAGYGHGANYDHCEQQGIDAVIPPQKENTKVKKIPVSRFKYDAKHHVVNCPAGKQLRRGHQDRHGWFYRARTKDCKHCVQRQRCLPTTASARTVKINHGYTALLRARRRKRTPDDTFVELYQRHRWRVEGMHGEGKCQHGLRRAARRGLANVAIQAYLTAAVINLKRLAAFFSLWLTVLAPSHHLENPQRQSSLAMATVS